jgi:hypothetical protein
MQKNGKSPNVLGSVFSGSQVIDFVDEIEADFDTKTPLKGRRAWEATNEVTFKLADTTKACNTPASHGQWPMIPSKLALAWVMRLGNGTQSWIARCGDRSIGPTTLGRAKKAAVAMVDDPGMGSYVSDPIRRLLRLQSRLVDLDAEVEVTA